MAEFRCVGQTYGYGPHRERHSKYRESEVNESVSGVNVYVQRDADLNGRQHDTEDEPFDASRCQRRCREAPITRAECDPGTCAPRLWDGTHAWYTRAGRGLLGTK